MKIWVQSSRNDQFYVELLADNYKTLATSETYVHKSSALHAANLIKQEAGSAVVTDMTGVKA